VDRHTRLQKGASINILASELAADVTYPNRFKATYLMQTQKKVAQQPNMVPTYSVRPGLPGVMSLLQVDTEVLQLGVLYMGAPMTPEMPLP
jgi:hypothetical protein